MECSCQVTEAEMGYRWALDGLAITVARNRGQLFSGNDLALEPVLTSVDRCAALGGRLDWQLKQAASSATLPAC